MAWQPAGAPWVPRGTLCVLPGPSHVKIPFAEEDPVDALQHAVSNNKIVSIARGFYAWESLPAKRAGERENLYHTNSYSMRGFFASHDSSSSHITA